MTLIGSASLKLTYYSSMNWQPLVNYRAVGWLKEPYDLTRL